MMLTNEACEKFCSFFGVKTPILNAPMTGIVGPELVAAVSNAGGLGVLPAAYLEPKEIIKAVEDIRRLTNEPFAINVNIAKRHQPQEHEEIKAMYDALGDLRESLGLPIDLPLKKIPNYDEQLRTIISLKPKAITTSFGGLLEKDYDAVKEAGILVIGCASTLREAKVMRSASVDAIILQGSEAGGPRLAFESDPEVLVGLGAMLPRVIRATQTPILVAGGISCPETLNGYMTMGAAGAVIGTALLGTQESLINPQYKAALEWADPAKLILTNVFDGHRCRVVKNGLVTALEQAELKIPNYPGQWSVMSPILEKANELGREDLMPLYCGQGIEQPLKRSVQEIFNYLLKESRKN